jgi:prepilin-type N-terminal cleavage/methylation domain-containing protein
MKRPGQSAFTLIELLVVIAIIAILAAMLLPSLAAAKVRAGEAKSVSNLKQLGTATSLFASDNMDMFPPAGDELINSDQLTWDSYLNFYISGGHLPQSELNVGDLDADSTPPVLRCPLDTGPDSAWVATYPNIFGRRTYAMNAAGQTWGTDYQINVLTSGGYKLPPVTQGVGIYWQEDPNTASAWSAPSYKTSVVQQPSGTILLTEEACGDNVAENVWPCICLGPYSTDTGQGNGELAQISPQDVDNQGAALYKLQGNKFEYLFHDNHVSLYSIQQTVGIGSTNIGGTVNGITGPRGMWTIAPND